MIIKIYFDLQILKLYKNVDVYTQVQPMQSKFLKEFRYKKIFKSSLIGWIDLWKKSIWKILLGLVFFNMAGQNTLSHQKMNIWGRSMNKYVINVLT